MIREALELFKDLEGYALLESPLRFAVGMVKSNKIYIYDGAEVSDLNWPNGSSIRVFGEKVEVIFRVGMSSAAVNLLPGPEDLVQQTFLCWGRVVEAKGGWSVLKEERIHPIHIPVAAAKGQLIRLTAAEVLGTDGFGNRFVSRTQYTGFEAISGVTA